MCYRKFPYTNFHEMNLDEIINIVKNMLEEWIKTEENINNFYSDTTTALTEFKAYMDNYFNNLDVQDEINNKINEMVQSGEFDTIIVTQLSPVISEWLKDNITEPEGVVIDKSLSVEGACADAKATGVRLQLVNETLDEITEQVTPNIFDYQKAVKGTLSTTGGINESAYITTNKIKVKAGDVLRVYYQSSNEFVTANGFLVVGLYDLYGNFISRTNTLYTHEYVIPANVYYVRATLQLSFDSVRRDVVITKNEVVDKYYPFVEPNVTAIDVIAREKLGSVARFEDEVREISEKRSPNIFNPRTAEKGTLNITGGVTESSYITSDYIPVDVGDIIRFYYVQNGVFKHTGGIMLVSLYDAEMNFISRTGQLYVSEYTVPHNAVYVRLTIAITYDVYLEYTMLTINEVVSEFSEHVEPNITAVDVVAREMALSARSKGVNDRIIDFWGDSFIEMIVSNKTAISDYLNALLPSTHFTTNHGLSGETSGMVTARMGINEIFVTFANNRINASGDSQVTDIRVGSGSVDGSNIKCTTDTPRNNIYCEIQGVKGWLIHTNNDLKFTRETEGNNIEVIPRTKINVIDYNSQNHIVVFMAGKNDLSFNASSTENVLSSYNNVASSHNSKKFILLGVTNSANESYLPGTTLRATVETINNTLAVDYPNNFIDIQAELIARGLTLEGITPTSQDIENINNGFIPNSLMADPVHLNEYGREAVAKILNEWLLEKNWL